MTDGYALIRKQTLAWLLEGVRDQGRDVPDEVAKDLGGSLTDVNAPNPTEDRLAMAGPVLTDEQHLDLLAHDATLELPQTGPSAHFWQLVTKVTLAILRNEAEAVCRLMEVKR